MAKLLPTAFACVVSFLLEELHPQVTSLKINNGVLTGHKNIFLSTAVRSQAKEWHIGFIGIHLKPRLLSLLT